MAQLTRDEVHAYAEAMIAAIRTPEFQERVRAAMSREPTPMDAEAVMIRYEEVQADHFTNHYTSDSGSVRAGGASVSAGRTPEASEGPAQEVGGMCLQTTSDAPKLDGVHIVEQLKKAASVYKEAETLRLITQLCLLIEAQVAALPATVPALRHLYNNSMHGAHTLSQAPAASAQAGGAGHSMPPVAGASPQVRQIMEMAMRTLSPKQREILERVQQEMMPGKTPSPEDMRDVVLIQRQLAAFAQTMQKFGQKPSGRSSVDDSAGSEIVHQHTHSRVHSASPYTRDTTRMPPRSRRSPTRRPKSGGAHAGRISGSPITATSSRASEAGAAAKRRRADRRLNAISAESGCIDRNRNKGVRKSFADTATPTHLGTPSTPARATPITSAGNRETDEDETDTSQRFSNVSGWQHARETTPPNPTPTSPCTPADSRAAEQAAHAASAQRGGSAALSMDHDRVFEQSLYGASSAAHPPPATSSASSQPVRPFSAELLSQLLMAEAARAEAAATAGQHDGNSSDGGDYATVGPRYALPEPQLPVPVMATTTTEWCGYRRDSGTASLNEQGGEATLSAAASRLVLPTDCLTVCVGVVPLPGCEASSEGTACRKRSRWWPWSRTVSVVRSDAADGVVGEAASDPANHDSKKCGGATKATWLASLRNQAVSVLQLRPRNLYTSGQQRTAVAVDSRSASTILAPSSGATTTDFTETAVSISPTLGIGPTTAVRGWTGVFADVPIVLPGAQLACSVDAPATAMNACTEAHARGGGLGGRLQSEAVVCSAAASISVVLA